MQSSPMSSFLTSQLTSSLPMLLVFIGAAVAAAIFFRRAPAAAGMVLLGVAILALITIISIAFQAASIHAMTNGQGRGASPYVNQAVYFLFSCFRAIGTALFVAAAFVERPETGPQNQFPKHL